VQLSSSALFQQVNAFEEERTLETFPIALEEECALETVHFTFHTAFQNSFLSIHVSLHIQDLSRLVALACHNTWYWIYQHTITFDYIQVLFVIVLYREYKCSKFSETHLFNNPQSWQLKRGKRDHRRQYNTRKEVRVRRQETVIWPRTTHNQPITRKLDPVTDEYIRSTLWRHPAMQTDGISRRLPPLITYQRTEYWQTEALLI